MDAIGYLIWYSYPSAGNVQVIPQIDTAHLPPKIFMGYSDITACANTITHRANFTTFHGY